MSTGSTPHSEITGNPAAVLTLAHSLIAMHGGAAHSGGDVKRHRGTIAKHWKSDSGDLAQQAMTIAEQRLGSANDKLAQAATILKRYSVELDDAQRRHAAVLDQLNQAKADPVVDAHAVAAHKTSAQHITTGIQGLAAKAARELHALAAPAAPVQTSKKLDAISATLINAAVDGGHLSSVHAKRSATRISRMNKSQHAKLSAALSKANAAEQARIYSALGSGKSFQAAISGSIDMSGLHGSSLAAAAAFQAGFRGQALVIAIAVAGAESSYLPGQVSSNPGSIDQGLWQINNASWPQFDHNKLLSDPLYNAKAAFIISNGGKDWGPWTTFNTGAYRGFMGTAAASAAKVTPA